MAHSIPRVDIGEIGLLCTSPGSEKIGKVGQLIHEGLIYPGFVYLFNHGIDQQLIDLTYSSAKYFFSLPREVKMKYHKRGTHEYHGYSAPGFERLEQEGYGHEFRESFDMQDEDGRFPDDEAPTLRTALTDMMSRCEELVGRILRALALALGLHEEAFDSIHDLKNRKINFNDMRVNFYPAVADQVPSDAARCAPHTDYGTCTLLFQDDVGGLELKDRDEMWRPVPPEKGAILLNVGDLMGILSDGVYRPGWHRVLIPEGDRRRRARLSIAYFSHPDNHVLVKPVNGSSRFSPVKAGDYLAGRSSKTYFPSSVEVPTNT